MKELRKLHRQLGALLADPQPGLTWRAALRETLLELAQYAGVGDVKALVHEEGLRKIAATLPELSDSPARGM